jgi:hypothetical protein
VLRDQLTLDKIVELAKVNVTENRRYHAPNAMGNFCFDVTLGYRRLELPGRAR